MSPWHWLIVIAIAVLLFGARRLPDAARSLGRSARILKAELHDEPRADTSTEPGPETAPEVTTETASERPAEHIRRADDQAST